MSDTDDTVAEPAVAKGARVRKTGRADKATKVGKADQTAKVDKAEKPEAVGAKALTTKKIKRRVGKIGGGTEPKAQRRKSGKLASSILRQIADGKISNPVAAAKAFFKANPEAEAEVAVPDADEDDSE